MFMYLVWYNTYKLILTAVIISIYNHGDVVVQVSIEPTFSPLLSHFVKLNWEWKTSCGNHGNGCVISTWVIIMLCACALDWHFAKCLKTVITKLCQLFLNSYLGILTYPSKQSCFQFDTFSKYPLEHFVIDLYSYFVDTRSFDHFGSIWSLCVANITLEFKSKKRSCTTYIRALYLIGNKADSNIMIICNDSTNQKGFPKPVTCPRIVSHISTHIYAHMPRIN